MENYPNTEDLTIKKGAEKFHSLVHENVPRGANETIDDHMKREIDFMEEVLNQQKSGNGKFFELDPDTRKGMIIWGEKAIENKRSGS